MTRPPSDDRLVVEEFRLFDSASHAEADLVLAAAHPAGVPLLTSIADDRDVVSVRCVPADAATEDDHLDRSTFGSLVASWGPLRTYRPRIAETSLVPPTGYHLAVTESGINDGDPASAPPHLVREEAAPAVVRPLGLLWIGEPRESHAGLLVVVGDGGSGLGRDRAWPLALSESLGVRIYHGSARA